LHFQEWTELENIILVNVKKKSVQPKTKRKNYVKANGRVKGKETVEQNRRTKVNGQTRSRSSI